MDGRDLLIERLLALVQLARGGAKHATSMLLFLVEHIPGIGTEARVSTTDNAQVAWPEGGKMVRARFSRWATKLLRQARGTREEKYLADFCGFSMEEAERFVPDLATIWGDLVERPYKLIVATGIGIAELYEEFESVSGLSSCMTERGEFVDLHTRIRGLELWVAVGQDGTYGARALLWPCVDDTTGQPCKLLDRIYYSDIAGARFLVREAESRGYLHRGTNASYMEYDADGIPLLGWQGPPKLVSKVSRKLSVHTGIYERVDIWPYMDTFAWVSYEKDGLVLSSYRKPDSFGLLRTTDGHYHPVMPQTTPSPEDYVCPICCGPTVAQDEPCGECLNLIAIVEEFFPPTDANARA